MLVSACNQERSMQKRTIAVSIEPLRYFTEQIAGDKFNVVSIAGANDNPENFIPNGENLSLVSKSDIFIKVGAIGYENRWQQLIENKAPHTIIADSSEGIELLMTPSGKPDPHTWMSCTNAAIIARNIYLALAAIDHRDSTYFRHNLDNLMTDIEQTDSEIREMLTKDKAKTFMLYHPSLTYFANDYGLVQIALEQMGREPDQTMLQVLVDSAKHAGARVFYIEKQYSKIAKGKSKDIKGMTTAEFNPMSYKWRDEMVNIAKALR